jgi:hypothetical protein
MDKSIKTKIEKIISKIAIVSNLARKKCLISFILSIIKMRKVQLSELATQFNDEVEDESNERRLSHFLSSAEMDYEQLAILFTLFLPKGKVCLSMDRTEWDFGKCQVNILCLTAYCQGMGIPIYFEFLDNNSGNSNYADRIDIVKKAVALLGRDRISMVIGDREFVGYEWFKWLKSNYLTFCMRLPKHYTITLRNGQEHQVEDLLVEQKERFFYKVIVAGVRANIAMKQLKDGDFLILFGEGDPKKLPLLYRKRWSIETFFQSLKKRGYDLESTHIKAFDRLKKLFAVVCIAYCFCLGVGVYYHEKIQKIKNKKHGYKMNSFFKKGLSIIRKGLKPEKPKYVLLLNVFIDTFIRWLYLLLSFNQLITKNIR